MWIYVLYTKYIPHTPEKKTISYQVHHIWAKEVVLINLDKNVAILFVV